MVVTFWKINPRIYFQYWFCYIKGELDANRPVPFRLTPNIAEFVTPVGVNGVMAAAIVSAARCLAEPHFSVQSVLRAVLRDEMIAWHKKVSLLLTVMTCKINCMLP